MKKEDKKPAYIMCPRCELNYINKKDKFCTVCKAELGLVDPSILIPDEEEAGVEKLCPICHVNYIGEDEEICFLCQKEHDAKDVNNEPEDDWKDFPLEETEIPEEIPMPHSDDDEIPDEELEDEFASAYSEPDDFDYSADPDDYDEEEDLGEDDEDEDL